VVAAAPGIFVAGSSQAAAQNLDGTNNDSGHPAASGSVVVVYLTGQGHVDNPVATGAAAPSSPHSNATLPFSATIGGQNAPVQFLGLSPGFAGLAQANIQLPALASGSYPVVITVDGVASNGPELSVAAAAGQTPQLSLQGSVTTAGSPSLSSTVVVNGSTAYVCGPNGINVVDVSDLAAPKVLSTIGHANIGGAPLGCEQLGKGLIGIVNPQTLLIYDISNPTAPAC
jgi:LVIVD repeat